MADWESLLLERVKKRDQPSISDLLGLYASYTELRKKFVSAQLCKPKTPQDQKTSDLEKTNTYNQQIKFLQTKLSQLQEELTNSYRNKSNFDDSINQLHQKIERLENQISEKDKTISKLERTIAHLKSSRS
ncbi:uncharacterized protein cubi_02710 [Cryptosporidium ubiquitum]|uniref:Autophagy-related protein 16 domain-containing protein n=1 Tax=Cryptosporidium ubiquitum TaxID=857276 RepID=A0A1J4MLL0_9CRYT|nr:uncharacterized protein cubi_02710 [Cryptosporidium ubiquitum]OII73908.1 hypothetical protein cubi_02710 [Cryptosporidium ubiquitum]